MSDGLYPAASLPALLLPRSRETDLVEGEVSKKKRKDTHPESNRCRRRGFPLAASPLPTFSFK